MKEAFKKGVMALLPEYIKDKGNCTIIWTVDGKVRVVDRTVKTVIKNMANYYQLDLKQLNKTYCKLLSIKRTPPIPFSRDNIFIGLKTRIPISKNDGAHGYVRLNKVKKVVEKGKCSLIYMKNGPSIRAYYKKDTVDKRLKEGKIIEEVFINKNLPYIKEATAYYYEKDEPATKSDIALLMAKLIEMKLDQDYKS